MDKYKAGQIFCFILNNVLFTFSLNQDGDKRAQGQVKNIVFALSPFGLNLSHVSSPFLAPLQEKSNRVSLILDLDETLVHFFYTPSGGTFLVRPYAHEFLRNLSKEFEIIIFTAAMKDVFVIYLVR